MRACTSLISYLINNIPHRLAENIFNLLMRFMNITTTAKTKSESHLQAGVRVLYGVMEKRSSENVQVLDPGLEECGNG